MAPAGGGGGVAGWGGALFKTYTMWRAYIAFLIDNIPLCATKVAYVN